VIARHDAVDYHNADGAPQWSSRWHTFSIQKVQFMIAANDIKNERSLSVYDNESYEDRNRVKS
jgi:hypothetical protein